MKIQSEIKWANWKRFKNGIKSALSRFSLLLFISWHLFVGCYSLNFLFLDQAIENHGSFFKQWTETFFFFSAWRPRPAPVYRWLVLFQFTAPWSKCKIFLHLIDRVLGSTLPKWCGKHFARKVFITLCTVKCLAGTFLKHLLGNHFKTAAAGLRQTF